MNGTMRLAEYVLPGHPDKLCDRIADGIVDRACALDPDALVGVEVAVNRQMVLVDGRIAAGEHGLDEKSIVDEVQRAYADSGYGGNWAPEPDALQVTTDLCLDALSDDERAIRGLADDQNICTGYATGDVRTNYLPLEHWLAWRFARRAAALRLAPGIGLGPDGKLLVILEEQGESAVLRAVSFSLQHTPDIDWVALTRAVRGMVDEELTGIGRAMDGFQVDDALRVEINGAGAFVVGGPEGDNGLSGKKLVVDAYGPRVPIGGGALSGKDPHKVDRVGALRARQLARAIVETGLACEALVRLAFVPGDPEPAFLGIWADGSALPNRAVAYWRRRYDLSLNGSYRELGLGAIRFAPLAVWGHFTDAQLPWEQGMPDQSQKDTVNQTAADSTR